MSPAKLADVTPIRLEHLQRELRTGRSPATVANYFRYLGLAFKYAHRAGLLADPMRLPRTPKGATTIVGGAAIAGESFDKMIAKVPVITGHRTADSWIRLLRMLWESGLRLSEAVTLSWTAEGRGTIRVVNLDTDDPMLYFAPGSQKNGREQYWAMPLGFARLLRETPQAQRRGPVFVPLNKDGRPGIFPRTRVSATITAIAKAAGVSTGHDHAGRIRWATAHDMRRSSVPGCPGSCRCRPCET